MDSTNVHSVAAQARALLGVPELCGPKAVGDWLEREFDAVDWAPSPEYWANIEGDPANLINRHRSAGAWTVQGPLVRERLASSSDLEHLCPDEPDDFLASLAQFPPEVAEFARLQQRMQLAETVVVILEHAAGRRDRIANFYVDGPGQRLAEMIWAATNVVPRSQGRPVSALYRAACAEACRHEK